MLSSVFLASSPLRVIWRRVYDGGRGDNRRGFCLIGSTLFFVAALGIIRMPDLYNRMQSGSKCTSLGSFLFIMGIGISEPEFIGKAILLILFIVFTNPISFHSLARAAHT